MAKSLKDQIMEMTGNGRLILKTLERIASNPKAGKREREKARRTLDTYRPWIEREIARREGNAGYDLSRLTDAELDQLEALLAKARVGGGQG